MVVNIWEKRWLIIYQRGNSVENTRKCAIIKTE